MKDNVEIEKLFQRNYTSLVLTDKHRRYSVTKPCVDMDIYDLMEGLIEPILDAAGYTPDILDEYLGSVENDE